MQYSNLRFHIHLARRMESHLISSILPTVLFVHVAYLALYAPHEALIVRESICMFMLLTTYAFVLY